MSCGVAVIIPTYDRQLRVLETLRRIHVCVPPPDEIWVHIDQADGKLEEEIAVAFPNVSILTSRERVGPGGGRRNCLLACKSPYAVSLDDDSWPVDRDFFAHVAPNFHKYPKAAILEARIWHKTEREIARTHLDDRVLTFTGCGHAVRVDVYRTLPGYLAEPIAYGVEENDLSLQVFAKNLQIIRVGALRIFHDTTLEHHKSPEIVAGALGNIGLFTFVNYPISLWLLGAAQIVNYMIFCLRSRRHRGLLKGVGLVFEKCYRHRYERRPTSARVLINFLRAKRGRSFPFLQTEAEKCLANF